MCTDSDYELRAALIREQHGGIFAGSLDHELHIGLPGLCKLVTTRSATVRMDVVHQLGTAMPGTLGK